VTGPARIEVHDDEPFGVPGTGTAARTPRVKWRRGIANATMGRQAIASKDYHRRGSSTRIWNTIVG
jgi:hypothetical protein